MNHVMLDLETLDSGNNAAVVAIGAVHFDPHFKANPPQWFDDDKRILNHFYRTIDPEDAAKYGTVSGSTFKWWLQQSEQARSELYRANGKTRDVLKDFNSWLDRVSENQPRKIALWGNGATFDNVVLRNAFTAANISPHWHWRGDKCYRTVINLLPIELQPDVKREGVHHNAMDDALYQVHKLTKTYQLLGIHSGKELV